MPNPTIDRFMTPNPRTIDAAASVGEARALMVELNARHLPVVRNGELVGILSQRDLLRLETATNPEAAKGRVGDAMSAPPFTVAPEEALARVAKAMAKQKIGSAVVVRGGKPIGIFTTTDALHALADVL